MFAPGDRVRFTRRGRGDDRLYARARPQKVDITESYFVEHEISKSPSRPAGEGIGRIEIAVPYDGRDYFTRQAVDDVKRGSGSGERRAVIGHLLLTDYAKTDLRHSIRRHNQVGMIPITVPVTSADGDLDLLTADRQTCLVGYDYRPEDPLDPPAELDVKLDDPDNLTLNFYEIEILTKLGYTNPSEVIEKLRQVASFSSELRLHLAVTISLPVKRGYPRLAPIVRRMSVGWPTITSLGTTELFIPNRSPDGQGEERRQVPIRYNPDKSRLEWESIPVLDPDESGDGGDAEVRVYHSESMVLEIRHPGELFKAAKLEVNAEVEIPGYLLSGLEARLFHANGDRGRLPKLTTRCHIRTEMFPADVFAGRTFSPYQQFFFDGIIPEERRITDIVTVLRNARFEVEPWSAPANENGLPALKWLLRAKRSQGPDDLELWVAVEGKEHGVEIRKMLGETIVQTKDEKRGQLTISVMGTLPRDHKALTREMNALQQALRDRFRFEQTSGG
jgi:hypothetical protein